MKILTSKKSPVISEVHKVHWTIFTMDEIIQQRRSIQFCVPKHISGSQTFRMLEKTFRDDQHVTKIKELVLEYRQLTAKDPTGIFEISEGSIKTILEDHLAIKNEITIN